MTPVLRVAASQFELRPEPDFEAFHAHVVEVVESAARAQADLVVLPELVTTGLLASLPDAERLEVADVAAAYREVFPPLTDAYVEALSGLARRTGVAVAGGSHWRAAGAGTFRNTGYVAHPDGRVESQDKLHLTPPEVTLGTTPGDDVLMTTVGPARVAVQICADVEFPEVARHLALAGVDLIACPSLTWNRRGAHRVRTSAVARSIENQVFVAVAPLIGTCGVPRDGALHGTGTALVTCPIDRTFGINDGILARVEGEGEQLAISDLDLARLAESREHPEPPGLKNVRPDLYRRLAADAGATATGTDHTKEPAHGH